MRRSVWSSWDRLKAIWSQIKNGIAGDEQVATSNVEQLADGMAVKQ